MESKFIAILLFLVLFNCNNCNKSEKSEKSENFEKKIEITNGTFLKSIRSSYSSCGMGIIKNSTLKLSQNDNKVSLENDIDGEGGSQLEFKEGSYTRQDNKLLLDLNTLFLEDRAQGQKSKQVISEKIELTYNEELNGYLTEEGLNAMKDKSFVLKSKECLFYKETSKDPDCPESKELSFDKIGYFCTR